MKLKFFADHCISNLIMQTLKQENYEVLRLKDFIPTDSPDSIVISAAQELNALLLSLNGDFADIVVYPPEKYKGIIALQVKNHPEIIPQLMERLKDYFATHPEIDHYNGKLLVIEVHRIRIRE
jgi:predicted nuclease of predicted toxin-antitoxin system